MAKRNSLLQISEIANGLIDPVLARRAGINTMLLAAWPDIAGVEFAGHTRPEKIAWQRRAREIGDDEGNFVPGTLTIACDGARALLLTHSQDQFIQRVNGFFGFPAIDRIRIVQKPVSEEKARRKASRALDDGQARRLAGMLETIEDGKLKTALERLGRGVIRSGGRH